MSLKNSHYAYIPLLICIKHSQHYNSTKSRWENWFSPGQLKISICSISLIRLGECSKSRVTPLSMYIYIIQPVLWECNLQDEKCIYLLFWKCTLFSYSSNNVVSSFSLTNENAATYHKLICFEESTFLSCCLWSEGTFTLGVWWFFHLFHVIWCMITHFFVNVIYWVKTCVFLSINAVQSLVERSNLYISSRNICFRKWQKITLQNK